MIDIQFKDCCHTCPNIDIDYEQTRGFGEVVSVIGCTHSCVCGMYNAEGPEENPPVIEGFGNANP